MRQNGKGIDTEKSKSIHLIAFIYDNNICVYRSDDHLCDQTVEVVVNWKIKVK